MIIGDCPYDDCDELLMIPIAAGFERHACDGCGRIMWTRHSRLDPWSMTEAEFLANYDVDQETKRVTPKVAL